MDRASAKAYLVAKFDQLEAAIDAHDTPAAVAVIESIAADGYPKVAATVARGLIAKARAGSSRKATSR